MGFWDARQPSGEIMTIAFDPGRAKADAPSKAAYRESMNALNMGCSSKKPASR
jgi:hypothetical protein